MCGIIGILGNHEAAPIMVEALRRLEYRGYDSAGVATIRDGKIERRRAVGKLVNLSDALVNDPLKGFAGIGHTRWATHGSVTLQNAHPHAAPKVAVVHNGIIENFQELRDELGADGVEFTTQTDTETVVLLVQSFLDQDLTPAEAVKVTLAKLQGAYALCFLFEGEDDLLIAARHGPPLAIGHGDGEMYVGSDAIALSPITPNITYLEDGDWAVITRTSCEIYDANGQLANRPVKHVNLQNMTVDKAGHRHFMAKEIAEQPAVLDRVFDAYVKDGKLEMPDIDLGAIRCITMVACGTAYYACVVAKYWFEQIARIPVEVDVASEFRYREPPIEEGTLAIFVSQSGETADTLAALRYMRDKAVSVVSIVNVSESSIARESDIALPIHAGIEVGVASTKAFTCQLAVLSLLVSQAAQDRNVEGFDLKTALGGFAALPAKISQALALEDTSLAIAKDLAEARDVLFLGRGQMYPLAMEGALKLKEISYIHAEAYAAGELKHGPIALVDEHVPIIVLAPFDNLFDKTVSNMQEVMARGGKVLLITDSQGAEKAGHDVWRTLIMPTVEDDLNPILYAIPVQLLAYHTAIAKGTDVDQPRNLAKSVTVE